ncbi:hypothetical protein [Garicola koreensis]|uniref:Uncharacterized protein n=1 Tax=Garicola koreensis TaxID=1262554 RepID=A0A7W5TT42_9MICC|nr:hypothetical protein [Garicola koreensis]MBB3667293.1 hypothetical protein [Garicola koreensis]
MVIHTERTREEERVVAALRGVFDASVMNFGSYNLLYARNMVDQSTQPDDDAAPSAAGPGEAEVSVQEAVARAAGLLIGYRREPVELVLCPVDTDQVLDRLGEYDDAVAIAEVPALLNLTNLAGMATDESSVEILFSTGRRLTLRVDPVVQFPQVPGLSVRQHLDVEDFYDFLDHFMDQVEQTQP